jgi:hypothetical protein
LQKEPDSGVNRWYICQNKQGGTRAPDTKGYKYSWILGEEDSPRLHMFTVTDIKLKEEMQDNYEIF